MLYTTKFYSVSHTHMSRYRKRVQTSVMEVFPPFIYAHDTIAQSTKNFRKITVCLTYSKFIYLSKSELIIIFITFFRLKISCFLS